MRAKIRVYWVKSYGLRIWNRDIVISDPISIHDKGGAIDYMRLEMIPLLDASEKE